MHGDNSWCLHPFLVCCMYSLRLLEDLFVTTLSEHNTISHYLSVIVLWLQIKHKERVLGLILISPLCKAPSWSEWFYYKVYNSLLPIIVYMTLQKGEIHTLHSYPDEITDVETDSAGSVELVVLLWHVWTVKRYFPSEVLQ